MKMTCRTLLLLCSCLRLATGLAAPVTDPPQQVPLSALGDLALQFAPLEAVEYVPGPSVWAEVSHRPGAAWTLYAPRRVQQLDFLVAEGELVASGQAIAVMRGPEIHHWQVEFALLREQYELARQRYERNLPLYQGKTLPEGQWLEILRRWQQLQLEYEHMRHFSELLGPGPGGDEDSLLLHAPVAGFVGYGEGGGEGEEPPAEGEFIASFLPPDALRVRALVPADGRRELAGLSLAGERLAVGREGGRVEGYMVEVWSAPLSPDSERLPGEAVSAIPLYRVEAGEERVFQVPAAALMEYSRGTHLLVREGDALRLQAVTPLSAAGDDYLVRADAGLAGRRVLVTSVSAVQGVLLGLGDD